MPPTETLIVSSVHSREHAVSFINELTKSFVKHTLRKLMKVVRADCGALFLFDPVRRSLVLDSVQDLAVPGLTSLRWSNAKPSISIPLFAEDELFGLIKVGAREDGTPYSGTDLRFANALCNSLCRIVEDQIRFARARRILDRSSQEKAVLEKYCTVGKLAAGITGEINSPLDGALRYAGLMLAHANARDRHYEYLSEIKNGLERIADITASLSRMGNPVPVQSADLSAIDIHQLLHEAVETFHLSCKNSIKIRKHFRGAVRVRMDTNMRQVFVNLIKNAIDAMPTGGTLDISSEVKQAGLQIVFTDSGCGIPQEHQLRIFEPFFTTKPSGSGAGLGLSICKDIVAKCGGRIGVRSAPGEGTTFTILFPRGILA